MTTCIRCDINTISTTGATVCTVCDAGTVANEDNTECGEYCALSNEGLHV